MTIELKKLRVRARQIAEEFGVKKLEPVVDLMIDGYIPADSALTDGHRAALALFAQVWNQQKYLRHGLATLTTEIREDLITTSGWQSHIFVEHLICKYFLRLFKDDPETATSDNELHRVAYYYSNEYCVSVPVPRIRELRKEAFELYHLNPTAERMKRILGSFFLFCYQRDLYSGSPCDLSRYRETAKAVFQDDYDLLSEEETAKIACNAKDRANYNRRPRAERQAKNKKSNAQRQIRVKKADPEIIAEPSQLILPMPPAPNVFDPKNAIPVPWLTLQDLLDAIGDIGMIYKQFIPSWWTPRGGNGSGSIILVSPSQFKKTICTVARRKEVKLKIGKSEEERNRDLQHIAFSAFYHLEKRGEAASLEDEFHYCSKCRVTWSARNGTRSEPVLRYFVVLVANNNHQFRKHRNNAFVEDISKA